MIVLGVVAALLAASTILIVSVRERRKSTQISTPTF
jgi:hypothetical protein